MLEINLKIISIINHAPIFVKDGIKVVLIQIISMNQFFEPMIRKVFKRKAYDPANIKSNQVFGLPLV